jgi:NADH-quinone oxidoreductase subunit E
MGATEASQAAEAERTRPLGEETRLAAKEIMARYPRPRSALLPMLHLVQSDEGYVTPEGIRFCAEQLGLTKAEVGAVATFYTMFKRRPTGDYLVSVCTNTLCDVLGGGEIYEALAEHLGVGHDETTADGRITLEHAECLAACDYAPVVTVNYEFFDQQSTDSALGLVGELQAGRRPLPTRGAPLCTFREISRQLAGFVDERPGALDAGPAGAPTVVGNRLAVERGETAPPYGRPAPLDGDRRREQGAAPAATTSGQAGAAGQAGTSGGRPGAAGDTAGEQAAAGAGPATDTTAGARTDGPAASGRTPAEQSAAEGSARYGGPPGEASSGGGEAAQTSASDPASSPGSGVTHESDAAKAEEPTSQVATAPEAERTDAATAGAATGLTDTGETPPGRPGPAGSDESAHTAAADAQAAGPENADTPAADRPRPTNRGRKLRRER